MLDDTDSSKTSTSLTNGRRACRRFGSPTCKAGSRAASNSPNRLYVDYPYVNREYDTAKFRYGYQSFITPQSVFEYDMANNTSTLLKQKECPAVMTARAIK